MTLSVPSSAIAAGDSRPPQPVAYETRNVSIPAGDGTTLSGILDLPRSKAPHPAVLLITGAGPTSPDAIAPPQILADRLAQSGIGSLRYGRHGLKRSGQDERSDRSNARLVADAHAALGVLCSVPGVGRVGVVGLGVGGALAPEVANSDARVAFVVLLSTPALSGEELDLSRLRGMLSRSKADRALTDHELRVTQQIDDVLRVAPSDAAAFRSGADIMIANGRAPDDARRAMRSLSRTDHRAALAYDPLPALSALRVPTLVISGANDTAVLVADNQPIFRRALTGHPRTRIVVLDGDNHWLQPGADQPIVDFDASRPMDPRVSDMIDRIAAASR